MSQIAQARSLLRAAAGLIKSAMRILATEQRATDGRKGRVGKKRNRAAPALIVPSELDRARARRFLRGDP